MHSATRRVLACAVVVLASCSASPDARSAAEGDRITIRDAVVDTEIVSTPADKKLGLGQRDKLDWDHGMLFVYNEPRVLTMWMKGMRFDIDIVWIREGRIVDMAWRVPHEVEEPLPIYRPRETADMVLEVPAGYAWANGWKTGDPVVLQRAEGKRSNTSAP